VPVVAVALLTGVKLSFPAIGAELPFLLYFGAVLFAAWYGGPRPAALATALSAVATNYFFLAPYSDASLSAVALFQTGVFIGESAGIVAIVELMRTSGVRARRAARRVVRLQRLTEGLAAARTPEEVAAVVVKQCSEAIGAVVGALARPGEDGQLQMLGAIGMSAERQSTFETISLDAPYPITEAFRTGEPVVVATGAEYIARFPELAAHIDTPGTVIALPLRVGERTLGAVAFRFARDRELDGAERRLLDTFVAQAAQALDRAQAWSREVTLRQKLEVLSEVAEALSTALAQGEVARVIVERGTAAMRADTSTFYVLDEATGALELIGHHGVSAAVIERIRRISEGSESPTYKSLRSGEAMWVETGEEYARVIPSVASIKAEGPRAQAFWSVPLLVEGRAIGLLGLGFYAPRRFPPEERAFVLTFARQCAQALLRALRLEREAAARLAAEQAQSSLATTLRSIGDAVIATDASGAVTFMNPVAEALTGSPEAEARGRPLDEIFRIVNEQTRAPVESPVTKVLREGVVVGLANHTVLLGRREGQETPIDDSGAPIRDESGHVRGVVLVFRSVSEQKQEEARRALIAEATAALSASLDYKATLSGLTALLVPRFADWCAVEMVDEVTGRSDQLAVAHVDPAMVEYAWELRRRYPRDPEAKTGVPNVLRTGIAEIYPEVTEEMLAASAVDEEHLRISRALNLRSALVVPLATRGETLGAITMVYAESGRRYAEADLRFAEEIGRRAAIAVDNARLYGAEQRARAAADEANRLKDEFLATMSHELRTPLNAILGWSRMMSMGTMDETRRGRALETIQRNAVAMTRLVEDLLDVSRIISGKMRIEVEPVDLMNIALAAIESIKPAAVAKEIELSARAEPPLGPILGDPSRLQQVAWNLLSNAVKFTPKGGRVEVSVRQSGAHVVLSVTDTGAGIDPAFAPFVFDRFRQADGRITRSHGGLGLGLSIARSLVELHGGEIKAQSEGLGRGATFTVTLPIRAAEEIEPPI
jgi:PAS domain S-box-containing protein